MAYLNYIAKFKAYLTSWAAFATGNGSAETFDYKINTAQELNALRNATTVNDMIQLSNAYYDQVGIGRSINELYKKPKDYFADYIAFNSALSQKLDNLGTEVTNSQTNVQNNLDMKKSISSISKRLQLKLSLISSEFDQ